MKKTKKEVAGGKYVPSEVVDFYAAESREGALLKELRESSKFATEKLEKETVLTSKNGEKYYLTEVCDRGSEGNKKLAKELRSFLGNFFDPEENDPEIDYEIAIERGLSDFFLVRNEKGEIVSVLNSQLAELSRGAGGQKEETLVVWYVVTDPGSRGRGLATELYLAAYSSAFGKVAERNSRLLAITGETESGVEGYLNKMGRRRSYYEDKDGNFVEIPYKSPPSDADSDAQSEHFMAMFLDDRKQCATDDFLRLVRGIYGQYTRPEYFERDTIGFTKKYMKLVDGVYADLVATLKNSKDGVVYFFNREEREKKKQELEKKNRKVIELDPK